MKSSSRLTIAAVVFGGFLAIASVAWACTSQAGIAANPTSGVAGENVAVSGDGFAEGPVGIHWNTASGPVLGTSEGSAFSISIHLPDDASPDVYYLVAVGSDGGQASTPFEVKRSPSTASASSAPASSGAPREPEAQSGASAPAAAAAAPTSAVVSPTPSIESAPTASVPTTATTPETTSASAAALASADAIQADASVPPTSSPVEPARASGLVDEDLRPGATGSVAVGVGLLGLSLSAMTAGFAVAHRRRRYVGIEAGPLSR